MRRALLLGAVLALVTTEGAGQVLARGLYYRNAKAAIELWVPAGFKEKAAAGRNLAEFEGGKDGAYLIHVQSCGAKSIDDFIDVTRNRSRRDFPGAGVKLVRSGKASRLPAAFFLMTNLGGAFRGVDLIDAGAYLGAGTVLRLLLYVRVGRGAAALREARWMIATLRRSGERGLDAFLGPRRLHAGTGLSYRPPLGFDEVPSPGGVYAGTDRGRKWRLTVEQTEHKDVDAALKAAASRDESLAASWEIPAGGQLELRATACAAGSGARALVGARAAKGAVFLVTCAGERPAVEELIQAAEHVAMSFALFDVEAARHEAADAIAGLRKALGQKKAAAALRTHVATLTRLIFLPEARDALTRSVARLHDEKAIVQAGDALAATRDAALLPALLAATKHARNQGWDKALVALLETLGRLRGPKAIPVLLKQARRDLPAARAAAVRALGFYAEQRARVVKELVRLLKKEEAAGAKASPVARNRWELMKPAFQEALWRLTGESFASAAAATAWLKAKR